METDTCMYLLGCTIRELGLGFTPTPRAYEKPGCFHLLAGNMLPADLVPKIPALWMGRTFNHPKMIYNGIASTVSIAPLDAMSWMIDGDVYTTREPLTFSVGPTVSVIRP
ncbi:MAG: hypothetical protein SWH61_17330 [Thermodesulfobacteriota bacterium]|nr:hypothetical protein [Thermodesulfobacteriota bacterium]